MTLARVSVFGLALATVGGLSACPLENASFGRECTTDSDCGAAYACVDSTCLPRDLLDDPPPSDGGVERSDGGALRDAGTDAGFIGSDGGPSDAGAPLDDAGTTDAGPTPADAGPTPVDAGVDAGAPVDAGPVDAGPDAGGEVDGGGPVETELVVGDPGPNDPIILRPSSLNAGDEFGAAVAMNDETIAIGVPGANQVLLVDITIHPPVVQQVLTPPTFASTYNRFGASVALVGELLLVGAPRAEKASGGVPEQGVVMAYFKDGAFYSVLDQVFSPAPTDFGYFGEAVAGVDIDESTIAFVVGEPRAQIDVEERPGAVHTYLYEVGSGPVEHLSTAYSPVSDPSVFGQGFGQSVAISADHVVVGAPKENVPQAADNRSGHVYIYTPTTPGVPDIDVAPVVLEGPDILSPGFFGVALAIGSTRLHVGLTELGLDPNVHGAVISYNLGTFDKIQSVIEPLIPAPRYFGQTVVEDEWGITVGAARPKLSFLDQSNGAIFRFTLDNSPVEDTGPNPTVDLGDDDRYGAAIATNSVFIAVGAPGYANATPDETDNSTGAVVLFRR